MKAKPTYHKGVEYRSRLEAHWAIFLESIKVPFEYEPERFELSDGSTYLPDFYLPETYLRDIDTQGVYLEIKNENFSEGDFKPIGSQFEKPLVLFCGSPMQNNWQSHIYDMEVSDSGYQYYPFWDNCMTFFWCMERHSKIDFTKRQNNECPVCGRGCYVHILDHAYKAMSDLQYK